MSHAEGPDRWAAPDDDAQSAGWGEPPNPPSYASGGAVPPPPAQPYPQAPPPPGASGYAAPGAPPPGAAPAGAPLGGTPLTFRSWQPGIVALRPLPFGDFLTVPFRAMRFNRAAIVGGPMLMVLVTALIWAAASWLLINDPLLDLQSAVPALSGIEPATLVVLIVAVLVSAAADMIASSMVIPAVSRAAMGVKAPLAEVLRTVWSRIGALILLYLMLVPVLGILVLATVAVVGTAGLADPLAAGIVMVLIVFPLWIVIALFTSAYVSVARGAIIMERAGPIQAIKRAFTLMPGRLWWSVLIIFVTAVMVGVIGQALSFITQIGVGLSSLLGPDQVWVGFVILALSTVFQLAVQYVLQYSFLGSVTALIYLDLRFRKEGLAFELARAAEAQQSAGPRIG